VEFPPLNNNDATLVGRDDARDLSILSRSFGIFDVDQEGHPWRLELEAFQRSVAAR
jgi:hypothetical protein